MRGDRGQSSVDSFKLPTAYCLLPTWFPSPQSSRDGFTLIEIMVTLVIVSIGLLATGSFTLSAMDGGEVSRERLTAVHLTEQVIEDWQHDANDQPQAIACASGNVTPAVGSTVSCTPVSGVAIPYGITLTVSQATAPLPPGAPGNSGASIAFGPLTWQGTATPSNPVNVKVVNVTWTHKGKSHAVFLTHITGAK